MAARPAVRGEVHLAVFDGYKSSTRNDHIASETKLGGSASFFPQLQVDQARLVAEWTTCGSCHRQMFLYAQAFCPLPEVADPNAKHHRVLYVYCCNSAECSLRPSQSWCALSHQCGDEDAPAPEDGEGSNNDSEDEVEGIDGTPTLLKAELPASTFPPCYLYVLPEPQKEVIVPTEAESEIIQSVEKGTLNPDITLEDMEELERNVDLKDKQLDEYYEKFRARIARAPRQVLRYHQRESTSNSGSSGSPSLPSALRTPVAMPPPIFMNRAKIRDLVLPPCPRCGSGLVHELQVMPTSLFFLRVKDYMESGYGSGDDGVDFATATVYTCSKGCTASYQEPEGLLQKEFVFVEPAPALHEEFAAAGDRVNLASYFTGYGSK